MSRGRSRKPYNRSSPTPTLFGTRSPKEFTAAELADLAIAHIVGEHEDVNLLIAYLQRKLERDANYLDNRNRRGIRTNTDEVMWQDMQVIGLLVCLLQEGRLK